MTTECQAGLTFSEKLLEQLELFKQIRLIEKKEEQ